MQTLKASIEAEMARSKKDGAAIGHLGLLEARLAKLRAKLMTPKGDGESPGEGLPMLL